jgi:sugar (pentulose or hexulose) kinase
MPARPDLLLAVDVGTQSVRALLFDREGERVARAAVPLLPPFTAPAPGAAEQDPAVWWAAVVEAVTPLWRREDPARVAALALTTQRGTVVCADGAGTPLRPAIVWPDQRLASRLPPLGAAWSAAFTLAGARPVLRHLQRQAECNWLAQHEPALWQRAERFGLLSAWLTQRLVGDWVDSVASQVGYLPFDYRRQAWATAGDWRWRALAVRPAQLPRLVPAAQPLGTLTAGAAAALGLPAGLRVVAAAADKACEVLGCAALDPTTAQLSFGTAASVNATLPRYLEVQRLLPAYPAAVPGAFNSEVHVARGFWLVGWFQREFGVATAELEGLLAATPPGALGLTALPHWSPGLRDPGPEARGALVGFGDVHGKAHVYRALIEGLVLQLRAGRDTIARRSGTRFTRLVVAGGGSQSDGAMQIAADVFGLPAERARYDDASALGAAMLAAAGLGWHAGVREAAAAMARRGRTFTPDAAATQHYEARYREVFRPLAGVLAPLNRRLRRQSGYPPAD